MTVHWEDERSLDILKRKTEVSYPLGETEGYQDQSRHFELDLNEDVLSDSDSEEPIEES